MSQVSKFQHFFFAVCFIFTLTVYAENKRKRQSLQILVITGVGLLSNLKKYALFLLG